MNKISNIYVGNAPLVPTTGGGSLNINDYLTNPVPLQDVEWNTDTLNGKLIFADFISGTYRYTGYLCKYTFSNYVYGDGKSYNDFDAPSISIDSGGSFVIRTVTNSDNRIRYSDGTVYYFSTTNVVYQGTKEGLTDSTTCKIFIGDPPALLSL